MKIKRFNQFNEAISGTMDTMPFGPGFPRAEKDKLNSNSLIYSEEMDKFYTEDDYQNIYNEYLKAGGEPLFGFNKDNLNIIIQFLKLDQTEETDQPIH